MKMELCEMKNRVANPQSHRTSAIIVLFINDYILGES